MSEAPSSSFVYPLLVCTIAPCGINSLKYFLLNSLFHSFSLFLSPLLSRSCSLLPIDSWQPVKCVICASRSSGSLMHVSIAIIPRSHPLSRSISECERSSQLDLCCILRRIYFFGIHSTAIRSSPSIEKFYFRWCIVAYHLPLAMYCRRFCNCIYLQGDVSWKLWGLGDIIQESFGKQNFSDTPLEMSRLLTKGKLSRIPPQAAHSVHRRYRHLSATIVPATQTSKTCLYSQVFDDK